MSANKAFLVSRLKLAKQVYDQSLKELALHHPPPLKWEPKAEGDWVLWVGTKPAAHVYPGIQQKLPKGSGYLDRWFARIVLQDSARGYDTVELAKRAAEDAIKADILPWVNPLDYLAPASQPPVPESARG